MASIKSPRLDRFDWFQLILCLLGGCGMSFALLYVALNTLLEPKLLEETALRATRSTRLVELALEVLPPDRLPPGVIVSRAPNGPEKLYSPLGPYDLKVQRLMEKRYGLYRQLQRDEAPFVESWGGLWVHLKTARAPDLWLYQPERLSSSSVWFLPLVRSGALLLGLVLGMIVFINKRVEIPFRKVFTQLPDGLPAPLPLLPEGGIAPLRVLSLRINRLLERLNNAASERRLMLSGLAHDLAGPQTRITLHLDLLADTLSTDHQEAFIALSSDLHQLRAITEQLGVLAERDQPGSSVRQLALDDLCARVAASYGRRSIRLQVPRLLVRLDGQGLERSLRNLIDNAFDHGEPPVELAAWRSQAGLVLEVRDHGQGVETSTLLTSTPQSPVHDRQRTRHRGLGLAIVERYCRDHHGNLSLRQSHGLFCARMQLVATREGPVLLNPATRFIPLAQPSK
ncbi:MAG: HAMP domain-containing histidine kinase [Cyanobacteria bacterium K_Offshore_surface_m2_239]|nr:HAMP domain-containing histidine kinase [Cyanobacteria bacterium K_Offshore_surface_m2_239]